MKENQKVKAKVDINYPLYPAAQKREGATHRCVKKGTIGTVVHIFSPCEIVVDFLANGEYDTVICHPSAIEELTSEIA